MQSLYQGDSYMEVPVGCLTPICILLQGVFVYLEILYYLCAMGTKWMIENIINGYPEWMTGNHEWSTDVHKCLQFDTKEDATAYMLNTDYVASITEHMFMSPLSTVENQN